jgi:hypothetical protein
MKTLGRFTAVLLSLVFATFSLMAQESSAKKEMTFKGYLADKMCGTGFTKSGDSKVAAAKAKKHTKDCVLADNCKASGFGLVIGAKYHKFDDAGDKLALDYLNNTKKESNLWVEVKGTADGDNIMVASISDVKATSPKKK